MCKLEDFEKSLNNILIGSVHHMWRPWLVASGQLVQTDR